MDDMRWTLLIIGGLLVLGIYLFGVWNKSNILFQNETKERVEPILSEINRNLDRFDEKVNEDELLRNIQDLTLDPTFKEIKL